MNLIAAVDEDFGLGKDNRLLAYLPGDLQYFKKHTMGKVIVLGRKTLESFKGGKPLPNRIHVVLSRNESYKPEGVAVVHSIPELMECLKQYAGEDIYVAGGGDIYKQLLPYCDTLYLTKVHGRFEADTRLEELEKLEEDYSLVWESDEQEESGLTYHWQTWKKL